VAPGKARPFISGEKKGGQSFIRKRLYASIFLLYGGFSMSLYYQVCSSFSFSESKPALVAVTLHTTSEYFPFLVGSYSSLSNSRFFRSLSQAQQYIGYLFLRYPNSKAARPVLDAEQLLLFGE
jgi:hypothetical protein